MVTETDPRLKAEETVFDILPGQTPVVEYAVTAWVRGVYNLETVTLSLYDPLGIARICRTVEASGRLVVYPVPEKAQAVLGGGVDRGASYDVVTAAGRGSGTDFQSVRPYVPGDPLRRMHWKTLARTGRFHVLEFDEPHMLSLTLVLDCYALPEVVEAQKRLQDELASHAVLGSEDGERPWRPISEFEVLIRAAASVAADAIGRGALVQLLCTSRVGAEAHLGRGTEQLFRILEALAVAEPEGGQRLSEALDSFQSSITSTGAAILFTCDPDTAVAERIALYRFYGLRSVLVMPSSTPLRDGELTWVPADWINTSPERGRLAEQVLMAGGTTVAAGLNADGSLSMIPVEPEHVCARD